MAIITAEVIAQVVAMNAEGKKASTIAMTLKVKKSEVEGILAGTITEGQPEVKVDVKEEANTDLPVQGAPTNAMIEQLKAQQAVAAQATGAKAPKERKARSTTTLVKVKASSSKDAEGNSIQRRNTNCDTRAVAAFYSPSLNMCWIGSHLGFATKTPEGAMKIMRTAPQKALDPLKTAEDVIMVIEATNVPVGPELEAAKMAAYVKYEEQKMIMLCRKPKIEVAAPAPEVKPEAQVQPEQTEADKLAAELASPEADALAVAEAELLAQELEQDEVQA